MNAKKKVSIIVMIKRFDHFSKIEDGWTIEGYF